jgi:hypothetical protein
MVGWGLFDAYRPYHRLLSPRTRPASTDSTFTSTIVSATFIAIDPFSTQERRRASKVAMMSFGMNHAIAATKYLRHGVSPHTACFPSREVELH